VTLQLGVLVSGGGTNLQALLDSSHDGRLDARIRLVISNRPEVQALERARKAGIPHLVVNHQKFASRQEFDSELVRALQEAGVQWVALAGFMRVLTPVFLDAFKDRVINIHPSLLPAFPGVDAQGQAFRAGVRVAGCTVHFVDNGVDTGPILVQRAVPVFPDDSEQALRERILEAEHEAFVEGLSLVAAGKIRLVETAGRGKRVFFDAQRDEENS